MELPILYEDEDVLAVNKPPGLLVHSPAEGNTEPTVVDWIAERYPELEEVGEAFKILGGGIIKRPGIVHRLDRETSGVLLVAKTEQAYNAIKKRFHEREIKKIYNAFAWGLFKESQGIIDRSIGRSPRDPRKRIATRGAKGKMREAVTEYTVLQQGEEIAFVEARPVTGRTHQIRTHFLAINHPLVGDALYAPKRPMALGFTRLALHAKSIKFRLPLKAPVTIDAPLPEDFRDALEKL